MEQPFLGINICRFFRFVTHNQRGNSRTLGCKLDLRITFSILVVCVPPGCMLQAFPPTNKVIYAKHRAGVLLLLLLGKRNLIIVSREIHNLENLRLCFWVSGLVTSVVEPANKLQAMLFTHTQHSAINFWLKIQSDVPQNLSRVTPLSVADDTWARSSVVSLPLVHYVCITEWEMSTFYKI
jgi:hypothetical protein